MKELKETHQIGLISIENLDTIITHLRDPSKYLEGDFGIQIARDGRVWICINGIAFIRFKPQGMGFGEVIHNASEGGG